MTARPKPRGRLPPPPHTHTHPHTHTPPPPCFAELRFVGALQSQKLIFQTGSDTTKYLDHFAIAAVVVLIIMVVVAASAVVVLSIGSVSL